jgi:hypothetical protein
VRIDRQHGALERVHENAARCLLAYPWKGNEVSERLLVWQSAQETERGDAPICMHAMKERLDQANLAPREASESNQRLDLFGWSSADSIPASIFTPEKRKGTSVLSFTGLGGEDDKD